MKICTIKVSHLAVLVGSVAVLTACASAPKAAKFAAPAVTVNAVQLSLSEKYSNPTFYNQDELSAYLTDCIHQSLNSKGKVSTLANAPQLNIDLNYQRVFSGEAFGMQKSLGAVHFDYQYQITQNGQVLH